uniref:MFS domain-containing protein n=1 Tax=Panagrellus redivivus TaxID=6233 RepID=A0A7E4VBD8_PANRE
MSVTCVTGAALMWTLPYIKYMGDQTFLFFWICAMFSIIGATYTLVPSAVHKCFGSKNLKIAYGVIQISISFSGMTLLPTSVTQARLRSAFPHYWQLSCPASGNDEVSALANPNYIEDAIR